MLEDAPANELTINDSVSIPLAEVQYRFTRSSGPGGQHTNKTETSVELLFDLAQTTRLTDAEKALAQQRLASYLDSEGVLHMESQSERSQLRNREQVTSRFVDLLRKALTPVKRRKRTRVPRGVKENRLANKRRTSLIKRDRRTKKEIGD